MVRLESLTYWAPTIVDPMRKNATFAAKYGAFFSDSEQQVSGGTLFEQGLERVCCFLLFHKSDPTRLFFPFDQEETEAK